MVLRDDAPFSNGEYDAIKRLSWCWDADDYLVDVSEGYCKDVYEELQEYYKKTGDSILFVIPVNCCGCILRMYTRNLRHAYECNYLPYQMLRELVDVTSRYMHNGYKDLPEVLDSNSLSTMHPEIKAIVEKYMCTIHVGQVVISTEICEKRNTSWVNCFTEPYKDVLVALNI